MKRILRLLFPLMFLPAFGQVPVSPIVQPHMTFNDTNGLACTGCKLNTYAAGTTTPLATYTDASGTSQNTNPVVMNADGGPPSGIWLGPSSYKLVLVNASGTTVWSVDQVTASTLAAALAGCGTANAVQISNTAKTGLTCDPSITINTTSHTLNVGTLTPAHVTIGALATPTSWTFDTSTPATALASIGGGTLFPAVGIGNSTGSAWGTSYSATNQIPATFISILNQPTTSTAGNLSGTPALPNGVTATTQPPGTNNTTLATMAAVQAALTATSRVCNANGCYRIDSDGTIEEWGVSSAVPTGADANTVTVTFPHAFTTTSNLSYVAWADSCATTPCNTTNKNPLSVSGDGSGVTTTSVVNFVAGVVPTGGGGVSLGSTIHIHWQAKGQ